MTAQVFTPELLSEPERYRAKTLPSMGQLPRAGEGGEQISFM